MTIVVDWDLKPQINQPTISAGECEATFQPVDFVKGRGMWAVKNQNSVFESPHDKTNKVTVRPAKTQISLGICPDWSESLLCTQRVAKDPSFVRVDSEDSDLTGQMPRLIWVYARCTCHFVGFVMRRFICCTAHPSKCQESIRISLFTHTIHGTCGSIELNGCTHVWRITNSTVLRSLFS